jgi:hypothetical protein
MHRKELQGIGRMFDLADGIMGVDFDDCLDDHGNIIPNHFAAEWLPRLNSYSEISPSGGFTISDSSRRAIVERLLDLNYERHAEEGRAGLDERKTNIALPKRMSKAAKLEKSLTQGRLL